MRSPTRSLTRYESQSTAPRSRLAPEGGPEMTRTKDVNPARALQEMPNVGPAIARDLLRLGHW